jgi:hypothetical protein
VKLVSLCAALVAAPLAAQSCCDLSVSVHDAGHPVEATVLVSIGNTAIPFNTMPSRSAGHVYVGAGDGRLFQAGEVVQIVVDAPGYAPRFTFRQLPHVLGDCGAVRVESVSVDLSQSGPSESALREFLHPKVQAELADTLRWQSRGRFQSAPFPVAPWPVVPPPPPSPGDCERRTTVVSIRSVPCSQTTHHINSVEYVDGSPTSRMDLTEKRARTYEVTTAWDASLSVDAQIQLSSYMGGGFEASASASAASTITTRTSVTVDIDVGGEKFPGRCGEICVGLLQTEIVMQRWKRCLSDRVPSDAWTWQPDGPPFSQRVPTGYCSYSRLYPCNNPPTPVPTCGQ